MENIIFYGAGEAALKKLDLWEQVDLVPVCFVDADERKHYTKLDGRYDILPLGVAIEKYPNFLIYLTVGVEKWKAIRDFLIDYGIAQDRIKVHDGIQEYEYRKGCYHLGTYIKFQSSVYETCWLVGKATVASAMNFEEDYYTWRNITSEIIERLRKGKPTSCDGCRELQEGFYITKPILSTIQIGGRWAGSRCNFRCTYCYDYGEITDKWHRRYGYPIDPLPYERTPATVMREAKKVCDKENIDVAMTFTAGEFCALTYCDEILELLSEYNWNAYIFTNASIYNTKLAALMRNGKITLDVSLDCGTAETFKKIKGVDCFSKVLSNLKKYYEAGAKIDLKYILLSGVNDNEADIQGFVEIAQLTHATVLLSAEIEQSNKVLEEHTRNMAIQLIKLCQEKGVVIFRNHGCKDFNASEIDYIDTVIGQ